MASEAMCTASGRSADYLCMLLYTRQEFVLHMYSVEPELLREEKLTM